MIRSVFWWLATLFALSWPLFVLQGPIGFADTDPYVRGAATGLHVTFGYETPFLEPDKLPSRPVLRADTTGVDPAAVTDTASPDGDRYVVSVARSPYYGTFLLSGILVADRAGPVLFQGLAVLLAVWLTARAMLGSGRAGLPALTVTGLVTPLALYVDYMMPDIFAGIAILAVANLILLYDRQGAWARAAWVGLLSASLLFHTSHLLVSVVLVPMCVLLAFLLRQRVPAAGIAGVAASVVLCLAGNAVFSAMVERSYGESAMRPPFLSARLIADGAGYRHLVETCPGSGYALCAYLDRMPGEAILAHDAVHYSDVLLWEERAENGGIFEPAGPEERKRLADEQLAFAIDVVRSRPFDVVGGAVRNSAVQLFLWRTAPLGHVRDRQLGPSPLIDPGALISAFPFRMQDWAWIDRLTMVTLGAGLIALLAVVFRPGLLTRVSPTEGASGRAVLGFAAAILLGLAVNAVVLGSLSAPHDRYQARVIWLAVLAPLMILAWYRRSNQPAASPTLTGRR